MKSIEEKLRNSYRDLWTDQLGVERPPVKMDVLFTNHWENTFGTIVCRSCILRSVVLALLFNIPIASVTSSEQPSSGFSCAKNSYPFCENLAYSHTNAHS